MLTEFCKLDFALLIKEPCRQCNVLSKCNFTYSSYLLTVFKQLWPVSLPVVIRFVAHLCSNVLTNVTLVSWCMTWCLLHNYCNNVIFVLYLLRVHCFNKLFAKWIPTIVPIVIFGYNLINLFNIFAAIDLVFTVKFIWFAIMPLWIIHLDLIITVY